MQILPHISIGLTYLVLGVLPIRFNQGENSTILSPPQVFHPVVRGILFVVFLAHAALLGLHVFHQGQFRLDWLTAIAITGWLGGIIFWVESLNIPLKALKPIVFLGLFICSLLPIFSKEMIVTHGALSLLMLSHLVVALLSYSIFTIAALHAALMATQMRHLHKINNVLSQQEPSTKQRWKIRWQQRIWHELPPLLSMEKILFNLIALGFIALSLTLVSGLTLQLQQKVHINHKLVFSAIAWMIFGWLLYGRKRWGWRGKIALRYTLSGFVALMLAYLGTHFVLAVLLTKAN